MDYCSNYQTNYPTLLVINRDRKQLALNSAIVASFNCVYMSVAEANTIVNWVQEHQPDLIIIDLKWTQIVQLQLISILKLDWLTRDIPILTIADALLESSTGIDYDAYLNKSHSALELEQIICSLISVPACKGDRQTA